MHKYIEALFQLTRQRITHQDIVDFSPTDPGYEGYVRKWTQIYDTGEVPSESEFNLSEVVYLTLLTPMSQFDPERYLQYHRFVSAVASCLVESGNGESEYLPISLLAYNLIMEVDINDVEHFKAVQDVLPVLRNCSRIMDEMAFPLFTLAALVLSHRAGEYELMPYLAYQLIKDEHEARTNLDLNNDKHDRKFLLGHSYGYKDAGWIEVVSSLTNPSNDDDVQLVIDAFAEQAD